MKKFLLFLLASVPLLAAADGNFTLIDNGDLKAAYKGSELILAEKFSMLPEYGLGKYEIRNEKIQSHTVINRFGNVDDVKFRREAVLKNNGKELEITFQFMVPSYSKHADKPRKFYALYLPYKEFANYKFNAIQGRVSNAKWIKGVIPANAGEDQELIPGLIRQITLTAPDNSRSLTIDFSVSGSNGNYSDYPPNAGIMSQWSIVRKGDFIELAVSYTPSFFGGTLSSKVQIYEATPENAYRNRHARLSSRYFSEMPADKQFVFGAEKFGKMYTNAGTKLIDTKQTFGWLDNKNLQKESFSPSGAYYSAVYSSQPATFRMKNLRKGLHLITTVIPTYQQGIKNMSIAVNGKVYIKDLRAKPMEITVASFPVWLENGSADVTFSGDWRLAALNDSLLQTSYEDVTFKRGYWVSTAGPHPSVMFQSPHYAKEPNYNFGIASYPLPIQGKEMAAKRKEMEYPTAYADFKNKEDWRYDALIGSLGPGNNGCFDEFADPAKLERRLNEIQNDNISVVMLNGFLSRHTYPAHLDRVKDMCKRVIAKGHERGMKFIDHIDYSLLWQCDSGYRVMTERMEQLQQTVTNHLPARGLCPTNPIAKKVFFEYMKDFVRSTDPDGIMIDEVAFHGDNFCGCAWCRKKFTADTNWVLPADETSEHLLNRKSPLWRVWLNWRQKMVGDFWVELRHELKAIKPELVFIGYTTHYGIWGNYASLTTSAVMEQFCRSYDFVGTEIMTRNAFSSYRGTYSMRKLKNMYRNSFDLPVFGLVYSDARDWDVMYFGWALNNMHAQTTWEIHAVPRPANKPNYQAFNVKNGNMPRNTARSMGRILLYFSNASRDCVRSIAPHQELLGWSQLLTTRHVPHEFINEAGLREDVLKNYPVLILATPTALRAGEIAVIKKYIENGGTVYASGFAGFYDENAQQRKHWLLGQELLNGADYRANVTAAYKKLRVRSTGEEIISDSPARYVRYNFPQGKKQLEVIWELVINDKGATVPALVCNKIGKGKIYFSPVLFGTPAFSVEFTSKNIMKFKRAPKAEALAWQIIELITTSEHFVWDAKNIPEQVLTNLYKLEDGRIAVHMLNATKSNYKPGDRIPSVAPANAYAPLNTEMSFLLPIADKKVKAVYACSPDFAGKKALPYSIKDGSIKVTVPARTLQGYMIIYID